MDWLTTLQNAGLPAISATVNADGKVDATFSRGLTDTEWLLFLQLTDTERFTSENSLRQFAAVYQAKIDRLQQIESAANQPFTQAGFNAVQGALRDVAQDVRLMAQILKNLLT